jgi:hypothetical protein
MCFNVYVYIVYDLQFMITFEFNDVYTCALLRGINDVPMIFRHIHPSVVRAKRLRAVLGCLLSLIPYQDGPTSPFTPPSPVCHSRRGPRSPTLHVSRTSRQNPEIMDYHQWAFVFGLFEPCPSCFDRSRYLRCTQEYRQASNSFSSMGKVRREYALPVRHFEMTFADGRVIALHLVSAALEPDTKTSTEREGEDVVPESKTAVLCYNVRGVGKSGGRQPWLGAGEQDYGAVERWGVDVTGVKDVWRFVCTPSTSQC